MYRLSKHHHHQVPSRPELLQPLGPVSTIAAAIDRFATGSSRGVALDLFWMACCGLIYLDGSALLGLL
jgi:hypothetical protein